MWIKSIVSACALFFASSVVVAAFDSSRIVEVGRDGVLRWMDNGLEVTRFGVNYYAPFSVDYKCLKEAGCNFENVMRDDVAHFRRLGLDCIRIHTFDREFSTEDGSFDDNDHVAKLDLLISLCASNGIQTVLTPIAWWGDKFAPGVTRGFSNLYTREQMTSDRLAWRLQARFLREFVGHANPYTGRRYGEDPAILAFELFNEPLYPPDYSDDDLVDYINTLADAIRSGGTAKPIFYNSWNGRHAAVSRSHVDGETNCDYPLALGTRRERSGIFLRHVRPQQFLEPIAQSMLARMIYEFDASDTSCSYLYPAMARSFRHQGVQLAFQFQYDPLPLARQNCNWDAHYLNLVYTPTKALSLAIAAKVFALSPRGCSFVPSAEKMSFEQFHLDGVKNSSQYVAEEDYWYTGVPTVDPPDPDRLRRIYGVGRSVVAACNGQGLYFLDKVEEGVWRLQLYPDLFQVNDPYDGRRVEDKVLALDSELVLKVDLPDLGSGWTVHDVADGHLVVRAENSRVHLCPGNYVLLGQRRYDDVVRRLVEGFGLPPYAIPSLVGDAPLLRMLDLPEKWSANRALEVVFESRNVDKVTLTARCLDKELSFVRTCEPSVGKIAVKLDAGLWEVGIRGEGSRGVTSVRPLQVKVFDSSSEWKVFDIHDALRIGFVKSARARRYEAKDDVGDPAVGIEVLATTNVSCGYAGFKVPFDCSARAFHFPLEHDPETLELHARGGRDGEKLEVVFTQTDGTAWGTIIALDRHWKTYQLPVKMFRSFWNSTEGLPEAKVDVDSFVKVNVGFGDWLFGDERHGCHIFEISDIRFCDMRSNGFPQQIKVTPKKEEL